MSPKTSRLSRRTVTHVGVFVMTLTLGNCEPLQSGTTRGGDPRGDGDEKFSAASKTSPAASELKIMPAQATLIGRTDRLQLIVSRVDTAEQLRDATHHVSYEVTPVGVVDVSSTGLVTPLANGKVEITARYRSTTVRSTVSVARFEDSPDIHFGNQISPIFTKLGCNGGGCHGKSGGQNGFALSLLGFEPKEDFGYLVQEARGRRLFPAAPERSLLLQKATGQLAHGGGVRLAPESDEYALLRMWISQGMPYGNDDAPTLDYLVVEPSTRKLPPGEVQQLRVTAHFSDGSTRDVTRQAQYEPNNTEIAEVDEAGFVKLLDKPGDVSVMVRYQGRVGTFQATVPLGAPIEHMPPSANFIDNLVFSKLQELGMPPSALCDEGTFLRRVTLDIAGRLPTLEETTSFVHDTDPNKRSRAVDRLLDSNEYGQYFALKWGAILRNQATPQTSRDGNFRFHDWLVDNLRNNRPYDAWVRDIVTASGDTSFNPAVSWHQHLKDENERVEDTAQVFLGLRIQCARCHHHPYEKWSQEDYWGLAAYYTNVKIKNNQSVYSQRGVPIARHPRTNERILPTVLGLEPAELSADEDPRVALADWLTSRDNPYFARALVNRYWKHFFGRGIVEPEDDMRETNPPANPALLDALANHFTTHEFDLKELVRLICNSTTYQLSSLPNSYNASDTTSFSRFQPRRLPAEVLLDGMDQFLDSHTRFRGLPEGTKAIDLPDHGMVDDSFLNAFGRPAGASACECERTGDVSMTQCLQLLNSNDLHNKLNQCRATELIADKARTDRDRIEELFLRAYSRVPTEQELETYIDYIESVGAEKQREAYEDVMWAILNTKEFLFNH